MHITSSQLDDYSETDLLRFLSLSIPEGHQLEYKTDLTAGSQTKQYHEFLKDVSAFANASGGILFLGVHQPSGDLDPKAQAVGIHAGDEVAHNLERLCASGAIDPRIPGLKFHVIPIGSNKHVVIVSVPPSMSRPHMVLYDKKSSFHIRHSESIQQMTTHEIRQAVLQGASAEENARRYLLKAEEEVSKYFIEQWPSWLIQSMPLIQSDPPIDTNDPIVVATMRNDDRTSKYGSVFNLYSMPAPRPTIDGILGANSRVDPSWQTEIHRNGYVSVAYRLHEEDAWRRNPDITRFFIRKHHHMLLQSFCHFCDDVVSATRNDVPYVVRCKIKNATGLVLRTELSSPDPWNKPELAWPDYVRQPGTSFISIANNLFSLLYNAFGLTQ